MKKLTNDLFNNVTKTFNCFNNDEKQNFLLFYYIFANCFCWFCLLFFVVCGERQPRHRRGIREPGAARLLFKKYTHTHRRRKIRSKGNGWRSRERLAYALLSRCGWSSRNKNVWGHTEGRETTMNHQTRFGRRDILDWATITTTSFLPFATKKAIFVLFTIFICEYCQSQGWYDGNIAFDTFGLGLFYFFQPFGGPSSSRLVLFIYIIVLNKEHCSSIQKYFLLNCAVIIN